MPKEYFKYFSLVIFFPFSYLTVFDKNGIVQNYSQNKSHAEPDLCIPLMEFATHFFLFWVIKISKQQISSLSAPENR